MPTMRPRPTKPRKPTKPTKATRPTTSTLSSNRAGPTGPSPATPSTLPPDPSRERFEAERLLDPKNDYVFKRLFGENLSLLQALVEDLSFAPIRAPAPGAATPPDGPAHPAHALRLTEILNPEIRPEQLAGKSVALDIRARDSLGRHIHVEMQNRSALHYGWRAVYYLARSLGSQLAGGEDYMRLHPVHALHLLNLVLLPVELEDPEVRSSAASADRVDPVRQPEQAMPTKGVRPKEHFDDTDPDHTDPGHAGPDHAGPDHTHPDHPAGLWHFALLSRIPGQADYARLTGGLPPFVLTFVELPRLLAWFARPSAPGPFPPRLQAIYDWVRFFLDYGALHMNEIVHLPVAQALRSLEALSEDRYARDEAFDREKALKDYNTMIKVSTHTGIRMGIEQGQREASRALLQDLLKAKFGTLPDWVQQRLEAASVATLRQLSVAVLRASTLEEVFREASEDRIGDDAARGA